MVRMLLRRVKLSAFTCAKSFCRRGGGRPSDAGLTALSEQTRSTRKTGLRELIRDRHHWHH